MFYTRTRTRTRTRTLMLFLVLMGLAMKVSASEASYVDSHCKGLQEYILEDRTRVDCLLPDYAVEYDWAAKWHEATGQALHYAMHTGRRAGIVLILRGDGDTRYVDRARMLIRHYNLPISLWTVQEGGTLNLVLD